MPPVTMIFQFQPTAASENDSDLKCCVASLASLDLDLDCTDVTGLSGNDTRYYITTGNGNTFQNNDRCFHHEEWKSCPELESKSISHVSSSISYHVGLSNDGQAFRWDDKEPNEKDDNLPAMPLPRSLNLSNNVVQVSCGANHTVFLTKESRVGVWGSNSDGQLGLGRQAKGHYSEPQFVDSLRGVSFIQVVAGGYHTFALSGSSAVFGWGRNSSGQLGLEKQDKRWIPSLCKNMRSRSIRYICCGENHTALLSEDGSVFSFGLDIKEESHVSPVDDVPDAGSQMLKGKAVSSIACTSKNTLAYVQGTDDIYVFGDGKCQEIKMGGLMNQCGLPSGESDVLSNGKVTLHASSGHSLALIRVEEEKEGGNDCKLLDKMLTLDKVQKEFPTEATKLKQYLKQQLRPTLGSESCWNGSFLLGNHQECSKIDHGVDMERVRSFFAFLKAERIRDDSVSKAVKEALKDLIGKLPKEPTHAESLRLYLMIPYCHLMEDLEVHDSIIGPFALAVKNLNDVCQKVLNAWLSSLPLVQFKRHVLVFKKCVRKLLMKFKETYKKRDLSAITSTLQACVWMMAKLYEVNERRVKKMSFKKFYIPELRATVNIHGDFIASLKDGEKDKEETFRFCKYPFLYGPECKSLLLKLRNEMAMIDIDLAHPFTYNPANLLNNMLALNEDPANPLNNMLALTEDPANPLNNMLALTEDPANPLNNMLALNEDPANLLNNMLALNEDPANPLNNMLALNEDPANQKAAVSVQEKLAKAAEKELRAVPSCVSSRKDIVEVTRQQILFRRFIDPHYHKRKFEAMFKDDEGDLEDAVGKGVYQEYVNQLFRKLCEDPGAFTELESSRLWFQSLGEENAELFHSAGYVLGLALYNSKLLTYNFPLVLFKKLLNRPVDMQDLEELKPEIGRRLKEILEDTEIEHRQLHFTESVKRQGDTVEVELCECGKNKLVTGDNREEYVELLVDFHLNQERKEEFDLFSEGFYQAFDKEILETFKFQPEELRHAFFGNEIDVISMRQRTKYWDEYNDHHPVIEHFWDIVNNMGPKEKKLLIRFITGAERFPHGGIDLEICSLTIEGNDTRDLMPVVATCSGTLFLPNISDRERLSDRIGLALETEASKHGTFTSLKKALRWED